MPALRDIQRAFARAVLTGEPDAIAPHIVAGGIPPEHRVSIYRNTARIGMTEALRLGFPAVERLVGAAFFDMAAARFGRAHPPDSPCLNDYGAGFADFLAAMPECVALPYLPDVARFEWALNIAAHAADAPKLDMLALAGMDPILFGTLHFVPHPSLTLLSLAFPADRIADAVLSGDAAAMAAIDLAGGPVHLVVHRGPDGVSAEHVAPADHDFLQRLFAGEPLEALLHDAPRAAEILAHQFALGRITGFATTSVPSPEESAR